MTCYNHILPPNAHDLDCVINSNPEVGYTGARAHHGAGVNVLFLDGSTRFISDSVELNVWRAMATRSGGEVVP